MAVSERRFGVEIECGHPKGPEGLSRLLSEIGYDIPGDYDGSGCEMRVGPLQGDQGFDDLTAIMTRISDTGGYITRSDGMHVHLEALDYIGEPALQAKLVRSWCNVEDAVEKIVAPYRRGSYACAPKIWNKDLANVRKIKDGSYYSRGNLNLNGVLNRKKGQAMPEYDDYGYCACCGEEPNYCYNYGKPTIEIRWHEGNLDPQIAIAWIVMGQRLLDTVAQDRITVKSCLRPATLMSRLDVPDEYARVLVEKARTVTDPLTRQQRVDAYGYDEDGPDYDDGW